MKYEFIGWCQDGTSDKIWAVIDLSTTPKHWGERPYATVWGRRGKALQHKIVHNTRYEMSRLIDRKVAKGYNFVEPEELNKLYPEFEQDLEKTAVWAMLSV